MKKKKNIFEEKILNNLIPVEFSYKDLLQVLIGASILAIPVGFTEETWKLGETLPWANILGLFIVSIMFISMFVYYHYHRSHQKIGRRGHWKHFYHRVTSTYIISFLVVAVLLTLIQRTPWITDIGLAIKRVIIVTFPASMSAVIADTFK